MIKIGFGDHSTTTILRNPQNSIGKNLGPLWFRAKATRQFRRALMEQGLRGLFYHRYTVDF